MKSLVDDSPELQYKIELYLAGMVDTRTREGDVYKVLSKLRLQEDAWNAFQPLQEFELAAAIPPPAVFRALQQDVRPVLEYSALRAVHRFVGEEAPPEGPQRRVIEDCSAKACHR